MVYNRGIGQTVREPEGVEMTSAFTLELLNELITAIGNHLGDRYTVCQRDSNAWVYNIGVIDNNTNVGAKVQVSHSLAKEAKHDPDLWTKIVSIMSREALRTISAELEVT